MDTFTQDTVFPRRDKADIYPWAQVPKLLIAAQRTLIGWAAFAPHPGQGEVKKLTVSHLQAITRKILEDESDKTADCDKIQYIPWTEGACESSYLYIYIMRY